jgi:hypothetical protein
MSFLYDALYLVEPLPALAEHVRGRVDPDLVEVLLEPRLFRQREGGNSDWLHADREAAAKLLFLASLREYAPQSSEFAAVFGSAVVSVALFDRWFHLRRFEVDQELGLLERWLRKCSLPVEPTGSFVVDRWLNGVRGMAEPGGTPDTGRGSG